MRASTEHGHILEGMFLEMNESLDFDRGQGERKCECL